MTGTDDASESSSFGNSQRFHGRVEPRHFADLNAATLTRLAGKRTIDWLALFANMIVFAIATIALFKFADANVVRRQPGRFIGGAEIAVIALLLGSLLTDIVCRILAHAQKVRFQTNALREDGSFLGARNYLIDDDGLHIDGQHGTSLSRWHGFTDVSDGPSTVLLWTDLCAAVMVPKDAIGDAAAVDLFKAAVSARIAQKA